MWLWLGRSLLRRLLRRLLNLGIVVGRSRRTTTILMRPSVLLHVVLARERLVALRTKRVFLASVLFRVAGRVSGSGEEVGAADLLGHGARILVLFRLLAGFAARLC